jgi:CheY-like chemotaxis protein
MSGQNPRILHIDDEEKERDNVRKYLEREDIPGWGAPKVVSVSDFDQALAVLEAERFDLVILDVRHGSTEAEIAVEEEAGVKTLADIRERRFVPVIFWTGLPKAVADLSSPLVRVGEKTTRLPTLKKLVDDSFATGLPALNRGLRHLVENEQREYMWGFVAEHWDELAQIEDHTAVAYLLARRLARSISGPGIVELARELGESPETLVPSKDIHPVEMYIQPPLVDDELLVGDILCGRWEEREGWWLVLTPSCDLLNEKADFVLLAAADPLMEHRTVRAWIDAESKKTAKSARSKVEGVIRQKTGGQDDRWLYLPAAVAVPDLVVDMQQLKSASCADARSLDHIASLDSPFAESAVNRFNRYYGRIGTPDFDADPIMARIEEAVVGHHEERSAAAAVTETAATGQAHNETSQDSAEGN